MWHDKTMHPTTRRYTAGKAPPCGPVETSQPGVMQRICWQSQNYAKPLVRVLQASNNYTLSTPSSALRQLA